MFDSAAMPVLVPATDVVLHPSGFEALGREPWLNIALPHPIPRGRTVELRYEIGAGDDVCRPILRFMAEDGRVQDALMPGASEGIGIWRGRVPTDSVEMRVSPTSRTGPFSFCLYPIRPLPLADRLRSAWRSPKRAFFAACASLVGLRDEADLNRAYVYGVAETKDFAAWRRARARPVLECSQEGPSVLIVVHAAADSAAAVATCRSLIDQSYRNWRAVIVVRSSKLAKQIERLSDPRLSTCEHAPETELREAWIALFAAGDTLQPAGLEQLLSYAERHPAAHVIYSDEVRLRRDNLAEPVFKPDWSPLWHRHAPYAGRTALLRGEILTRNPGLLRSWPDDAVNQILARMPVDAVGHLRRAVWTTTMEQPLSLPASAHRLTSVEQLSSSNRSVGIVIPTRDSLDLLRPCVESVLGRTEQTMFQVLIADNGSAEPETLRWFDEIRRRDARVRIAFMPGPFNFARICNDAAQQLSSDLLMFLNNDTEVIDRDWLVKLGRFAVDSTIGAVGAKLLFKDGRVQHAGVVLGLGGVAGHFGARLEEREPGWLFGNLVPHEVSAVTGACLMVERTKFWAVNGFDSVNLPVELNDIDLCLRLNERGWQTICDSHTRLYHHESASRGGAGLRLQRVYALERAYFAERWRHLIRDDARYNPSMSVYSQSSAVA